MLIGFGFLVLLFLSDILLFSVVFIVFLCPIFLVSPFFKRRGLASVAILYNCVPQIYASFSTPFTFLSPSL